MCGDWGDEPVYIELTANGKLPDDAVIKTGSFCKDAQGHWYLNLRFESSCLHYQSKDSEVGLDPGVKTLATLSDGVKIIGPKLCERYLAKICRLERTHLNARRHQARTCKYGPLSKRKRMAKLQAKIANATADYLHEASTCLVEGHRKIYLGNVPCNLMNRSRTMAAFRLDSGFGMFKTQVTYKAMRTGGQAMEINERDSTRTCSECLSAHTRTQLVVKEWQCCVCATVHDRDVNAARNILRLGCEALTHPGNCKVAGS